MKIPTIAKTCRAVRAVWMLRLLSEEVLHATELAVLFGISERQVQRDILSLKQAGASIATTPRGYQLQGAWRLPLDSDPDSGR